MSAALAVAAMVTIGTVTSCNKGGEDDTLPQPTPTELFSYKVDGIRDTAVERIGEVRLQLSVKPLTGKTEIVKLNASDLPLGVKASFSPQSGTPPFISIMTLTANKTPEGKYQLYVTDSARGKGISSHPMSLTIKPYVNFAVAFNGPYQESHTCSQSGPSQFAVFIEPVQTYINRIIIKGFWTKSWSQSIYADLNPNNKTVTVPVQTAGGLTYQGLGTFNDNEISINYTVTDSSGVVNESCTATFKQ
jgi:hypothetical protein